MRDSSRVFIEISFFPFLIAGKLKNYYNNYDTVVLSIIKENYKKIF